MATYAVSARIDGGRPRRQDRPAGERRALGVQWRRDEAATIVDVDRAPIELVGSDRWARVAELWAQTTFFLFDAESWRRG